MLDPRRRWRRINRAMNSRGRSARRESITSSKPWQYAPGHSPRLCCSHVGPHGGWGQRRQNHYKPYGFRFVVENTECKKKRKANGSSDSETENENQVGTANPPPPQTQYFIIEPETGRSLTPVTPFAIEKSLLCQVGNVLETRKLRSGSILVRVASQAQANSIINIKTILDINVAVTPHRTLNSCSETSATAMTRRSCMSCSRKVSQLFITSCQHEMALKNLLTHLFLLLTPLHYLQLSKSATCESIPNSMYRTHSDATNANDMDMGRTCASAQLPVLDAARRVTPILTAVLTTTASIVEVTTLPTLKHAQSGRNRRTLPLSNISRMSVFARQLILFVCNLGPQLQTASPVMHRQHAAQHPPSAVHRAQQHKRCLHGHLTPRFHCQLKICQLAINLCRNAAATHKQNLWTSRS